MTTNKPEVINVYRTSVGGTFDCVRLSDYERLEAECEQLRAAIRRLCNIYVVAIDYVGEMREKLLDEAVNRAIERGKEKQG